MKACLADDNWLEHELKDNCLESSRLYTTGTDLYVLLNNSQWASFIFMKIKIPIISLQETFIPSISDRHFSRLNL